MPTSSSNKPTVIVTLGHPTGIGPEVTVKAMASRKILGLANFLVIGDGFVIGNIKSRLGIKLEVPLLDLSNVPPSNFAYGDAGLRFGKASIEYIDKALEILKKGKADALVTAPVNKASVRGSGISGFEGHTEYLAQKTGTKDFAMMFVGENLKVTLATRHIPLKDVSKALSIDSVYRTIVLTHKCLKESFGFKNPKIGVCGLNPHAGEKGLFGKEEKGLIIPAIYKASRKTINVSGPIPADVVFYEALNKRFDAVVSMYHDQALGPFKMLYFKSGSNLTLGLPFIRTSPGHGTAFDIAGKGIADPSSMVEAVALACRLSRKPR